MSSTARQEVLALIGKRGRITFAEFMETALYHTRGGYYTRGPDSDAGADYYTSPAAHPAFGAAIAVQLSRMWDLLDRPARFTAVEMGVGSGLLARDVVSYAGRALEPFADALRYVTLDRARLPDVTGFAQHVAATGTPLRGVVGCLLSNELLDAFPVHRFEMRDGRILEVYVVVRDGELSETLDEPSTPLLARHVDRPGWELAEGFRGEADLHIGPWMAGVAGALERGFVLTVDYGYTRQELYSAERGGGTVQGYYRHTGGASPYQRVGEQDITAHVDFTHVVEEGRRVSLSPLGIGTQTGFLRELGLSGWLDRMRREPMAESRRQANLMGMRELVKPDGLGGFKVLVQEKGTGLAELPEQTVPAAEGLPLPLLGPEHAPLLKGRYPHLTWEPSEAR